MNDLEAQLNEKRRLLTEYVKEQENEKISVRDQQKVLKEYKAQLKEVDERIDSTLAEIYALEDAIKASK